MGKGVSLVLIAVLWIMTGVTVSAESETVRLGIEALESDEPYFDVTLEPGESADLTVRFSNHGEIGTPATVYAADVYTIPGGGMGMRQIEDPKTGPTEWLSFEADDFELEPGESVEQTFTVTVPDDTAPGDYITAIVIQNAEPAAVGDENQQFHQTIRQGVAVAINVPGPRTPGLEIGDVEHADFGGRSIVMMEIANTGNAHLHPEGQFALYDDSGATIVDAPVVMDTVYAGTETFLEIPLDPRLEPGDYEVSIQLADAQAGAEAVAEGIAFEVSEPSRASESDRDDQSGVVGIVDQRLPGEDGGGFWWGWVGLLVGATGLAALIGIIIGRRRARVAEIPHAAASTGSTAGSHAGTRPARGATVVDDSPNTTPGKRVSAKRPPIRQLRPPKSMGTE